MNRPRIGWREWASLPELGITGVKVKVDTGARTSALHAFYTEQFERDGVPWVRFGVHPIQHDRDTAVHCEARIIDVRQVTDSGGHREQRPVIRTAVAVGEHRFDAEFTLTNRDTMRFRVLLGRTALRRRFLVSPGESFILGGTRHSPPDTP